MKIENLYIVTKPGPAAIVVDDLCYGNGISVADFQLCTLGGLEAAHVAAVFTTREEQRAHARELLRVHLETRRLALIAEASTRSREVESIREALIGLTVDQAFGETEAAPR